MIALLNPRRKRRRKYATKSRRRTRRSYRRRRPLTGKALARTRAYRSGRRFGLLEGGRKCAAAVRAIRSGRKGVSKRSLASVHGPLASIIPSRLLAANRGRRSRWNYRRRRRSRNYSTYIPSWGAALNPYWVPQYATNPNGFAGALSGLRPSVWMDAMPYVGGAIGNAILASTISRFVPGILQGGFPNIFVRLASAGLLGAGIGMVRPGWAGKVFFGGVFETLLYVARTYLPGIPGLRGLSGLFDYLTVGDAAAARPLYGLGATQPDFAMYAIDTDLAVGDAPVEDISNVNDLSPEGMSPQNRFSGIGDYLTPMDAAMARPLGRLGGYTLNDHVIESTATDELSTG